jgi:hypothetical protein
MPQIAQDLVRRVVARRAGYATARVSSGAKEIKSVDRCLVARPSEHGAMKKQLIRCDISMKYVALSSDNCRTGGLIR